MKKILISAIAVAALRCVAFAAPDMPPPMVCSSFSSAGTNYVTNAVFTSAWVDSIVLDWTDDGGTSTQTGIVSIATQGSTGSGPARTIYSATVAATDAVVYPRATAVGTTGSAIATIVGERIPLVQDKLTVTVYGASTNATALTVRVITSPVP
jgi:hypothetical protein